MSTRPQPASGNAEEVTLEEKVRFLAAPGSHPSGVAAVTARETHMSWVFLAGDRALKLKKPVRFPYLDFSSLKRREAACRAEYLLNRRLAPDVYLGVVALTLSSAGLALGGAGTVVDWLVVMRRLDEAGTLEAALLEHRLRSVDVDRVAVVLSAFYRHARRVCLRPEMVLADWRNALARNRRVLLDPRLGLHRGAVVRIDRAQRQFLARRFGALVQRARRRRVVDAHGDLRPEHVWPGDPVRIIDCLEFDPHLRALDPLDEIAFLDLECARLGAPWVGERLRRRMAGVLDDRPPHALFLFYRCHRATLRARLAIAHLLDPSPRSPAKWPRLARLYLRQAEADAARLERLLRRPSGR